jgi:hypothetical protein
MRFLDGTSLTTPSTVHLPLSTDPRSAHHALHRAREGDGSGRRGSLDNDGLRAVVAHKGRGIAVVVADLEADERSV